MEARTAVNNPKMAPFLSFTDSNLSIRIAQRKTVTGIILDQHYYIYLLLIA